MKSIAISASMFQKYGGWSEFRLNVWYSVKIALNHKWRWQCAGSALDEQNDMKSIAISASVSEIEVFFVSFDDPLPKMDL